jgi:ADP-sugar diphosphatase
MPAFKLSGVSPPIPRNNEGWVQLDEKTLTGFKAFRDWLKGLRENLSLQRTPGHTFQSDPWMLKEIKVHSVTVFGTGKIGFMIIASLRGIQFR